MESAIYGLDYFFNLLFVTSSKHNFTGKEDKH